MDYHSLLSLEKISRALIKQIYNLKNSYQICAFVYLLGFLFYQMNLIQQAGTTWDDIMLLKTTPRIIEKFKLYSDISNPFLSEFVSNFEFYGFLVLIPAYIFSNNPTVIEFFSSVLNLKSINSLDFEFMLRHIFLNIYIIFGLYLAFNLYSKISTNKKALFFIILITLVPLFSGHGLFNLKDIPFLIQNLLAVLALLHYLKNFYSANNFKVFKLGIYFGLLLLIRFNGLAFMFLYFIFSVLYLKKDITTIKKNLLNWLYILITSLFCLFIGTPSSWQKPKYWLEETIATQFNIYWDSYVLINGSYSSAMDVDRMYLIISSFYKMPIIFSFFIILSCYLVIRNYKENLEISLIFSIYFILLIQLSFIILKPVAYDGVRQYLFLIPFYCFLVIESIDLLKLNNFYNLSIISLILLYLISTQYGLGPYKYIYLNEFSNEEEISVNCETIGGCGDWQTDYWGYSGKELVRTLENTDLNGYIYFCTPEHVFSTYLERKNFQIIPEGSLNKMEPLQNFLLLNIEESFYMAYVHRPMFVNDVCGVDKLGIDLSCKNIIKTQTILRNESVNLSYVDICTSE